MKGVRLANRIIGPGHPCFIIAEAGSNHDGNLKKALHLIDAAADSRANAVKFQLFRASRLYPRGAGRSDYLKRRRSIYDIIRSMELPPEWLPALRFRCRKRRIIFLASVFDEQSADALNRHVAAFKIASYELTHAPLVRHVAAFQKPVLMSTGASTIADIRSALNVIRSTGNRNVVLFQCTARYPAPPATLNLRTIPALANRFGVPVGLSDHSADPFSAPLAAVALGAAALEKHFTLSRAATGPDHGFSIEPDELAAMVRRIREVEAALGAGIKHVHPVERELHRFARRSIFTSRKIHPGATFSRHNLIVLRNGRLRPGLPPAAFDRLIGRTCRRLLPAGRAVQAQDIAPAGALAGKRR